jgi:hypothetical protein
MPKVRDFAARGLVAALAAAGLAVVGGSPAWAAACPASAGSVAAALTAALQCHDTVEATALRTERSQTFANANGSWTVQQFAAVQRVHGRDGSWVTPDASLVRNPDGTFSPRASTLDLVVSGGGSAPLIQVKQGRAQLALSWPTALPVPTVAGDVATYPDVFPGVDLLVRAGVDSFGELLVVKDAVGAANAALAKVNLGVSAVGVAARTGDGGSVAWVDGTGTAVFAAGASLMWDSSGLVSSSAKAVLGSSDVAAAKSSARAAGPGAVTRAMPVALSSKTLTLRPDLTLLSAKNVTYPVFIDPSVAPTSGNNWSMINGIFQSQSYWAYDRTDGAKVGYEDYDNNLYRSMFWFSSSGFAGATVSAATFHATLIHSASCTASQVDLYKTGPVSSSTTWTNHHSTWTTFLTSKSAQDCNDAQVGEDFTSSALVSQVQAAATGGGNVWLGLRAHDETQSGHEGWKKYDPTTAYLTVTYDHAPVLPSSLTSSGASCATGSGRPLVQTTTMKAYVDDVDSGDQLSVAFQWKQLNADGSYPTAITGSQTVSTVTPKTFPAVTPSLINGQSYAWQVKSTDASGLSSAWTGWCEFTMDTAAPVPPSITPPAAIYTSSTSASGDIGVPGTFTFGPHGAPNIVSYTYYLQSTGYNTTPATVTVAAGSNPSVAVTPHRGGVNTLFVTDTDSTGKTSASASWPFMVAASNPIGWWHANEPSGGPTLFDDNTIVTTTHDLTLSGSSANPRTAAGAGRLLGSSTDAALALNGLDDQAASTAPLVDTSKSFAVSAWAMPTSVDGDRTVVSQDATAGTSGFQLQISGGAWCFTEDATHKACSSAAADAPVVGQWTQLVAVYDATDIKLRLFVDGIRKGDAGSARFATPAGAFAIGRGEAGGAGAAWFAGQVDEVRIWQRVVYDTQIGAIANDDEFGTFTRLGDWELDGDGTDGSDYGAAAGHVGTPNAGASFVTPAPGGPAGLLALNIVGANSGAMSFGPVPVFRTDQPYTLSAWVRLNALPTHSMTAVTEDGSCSSGISLGVTYQNNQPYWSMGLRSSDCGANPTWPAAVAANPLTSADVGTWVHLVGVYDRTNAQLLLYVNRSLKGSGAHTTPWGASGGLAFGNDLSGGTRADQFDGQIDQVQIYVGAMTLDQIIQFL